MKRIAGQLFWRNLLILWLCVLAFSNAAYAQSDTSSLTGIVTDPASAVVTGARVSLQNVATGNARETVTDAEGRYAFNLVAPGLHEVTVAASGFKLFRASEVRLQVAQAGKLDISMEVGGATESVDVTGTTSLLNTEKVGQGTVIGREKIVALPLNGRQFLQLALLVPGANAGGRAVQQNNIRQGQLGGLSVSGGRTNNTSFLLDGAANTDPDYNSLNYSPSVDAISEFQVQTAMFSAEYGRASGGQINVVTKSGSNEIRGSAWEFVRNRVFDARPFNLAASEVPKFQRNQFGGTIGAPILRNRLFIFGAYESLRLRQAAAGLTTVTVPTALERQGDFSATSGGIFDPATTQNGVRHQFLGNRIPVNRINPVALTAIQALPLPNVPGTSLYVNESGVLRQDNDNYSARVDFNVTPNNTFFGRYSIAEEDATIPEPVPGRDNVNNGRPQNVVLALTSVVSSNAVNELRFGFNRLRLLSGLPELEFNVAGQQRAIPRFIVAGAPIIGGAGGFTGTTGGGISLVRNNTFQLYDNFSFQRGSHNIKFGGEVLWTQYNRVESANLNGTFTYNNVGFTSQTGLNAQGQLTRVGGGNAIANFLLALPNIGARSIGPSRIDGRQQYYSVYVQDDVRVRPNLTLNLGLRYELAPPMHEKHGQMSSIDYRNVPSPQSIFAEGRTGFYSPILFVCGQSGYPRGCAFTDKNNFAPRAGLAWEPLDGTVVRAGAGVFYAATDANPLFRLAAGLPGNIAQSINAASQLVPNLQGYDFFGPAVVGPVQIQAAGIDLFQRTSYSVQWNLSVQRMLMRDLVVEVGYTATLGLKLEQNVQPNNAQPGPGAVNPRRPFASLTFAPGTQFPDYINVTSDRVPVTFINYLPHSAQSTYHAFFMRLEKRFTQGFSFLSSYTLSKAITNAPQFRNAGGVGGSENSPPQDSFNLQAERGLAPYHVAHRWVTNFVYDLPWGRGKRFLTYGLASKLLGGFQLSGIYTMQTGFPFTVNLRGDTAGAGAGTGGIFIRPNAVVGVSAVLPHSERTGGHFLNPNAFIIPPPFTFGNLGRNTVIGPDLINMDFAVAKTIPVRESLQLQLRAEAFNVFNRPNYTVVGRIINDPTTFGQVLSQLDPRQLQFGVKIIF
ncbi:MAG: TonB-dependent receptor [Acidobacteriota bacterium]|nr:TonB-dependent receptor [Acidobacteriota bacterium]